MALITTWYPSGTGEIYENIIRVQSNCNADYYFRAAVVLVTK